MRPTRDLKHVEFETAMVPYMDQLYSYAFYLTGEKEQAGDLLQETYLKAFRSSSGFERGT